MTTEKCTHMVLGILDYERGTFETYNVQIPEGEDTDSWVEEFGANNGHRMSDCYWIITKENPVLLHP